MTEKKTPAGIEEPTHEELQAHLQEALAALEGLRTQLTSENEERSLEQAELFKALAKCQAEFETVQATADNEYFHSKYAPLYALWDHARPILKKHGLVLIQEPIPTSIEEGAKIRNTLAHTSGQWRSSVIQMPIDLGKEGKGKKAPAFGASYTYGRRYGMGGILGLATSAEDTDASQSDPDYRPAGETAAEKGWKAWADAECLRFRECKDTVSLDRYYHAAVKRLENQEVPDIIPDLLETVWKRRKEELKATAKGQLGMDDIDVDGDIPQ